MAGANPLWGTPRIHGELLKLGIAISERTVSRLLAQLSRPPSQPWRTFLANHLSALVSMDFFTVSTLTGRVLFVLVLMSHDRRRIVHVNVTEHPTSAWTVVNRRRLCLCLPVPPSVSSGSSCGRLDGFAFDRPAARPPQVNWPPRVRYRSNR
jgi:hypothetical protein